MLRSTEVLLAASLGVLLAAGCGGGGGASSTQNVKGYTITITGMTFSPAELAVPPGATIIVNNLNPTQYHTVTSEAKVGDFFGGAVGGVVFDTGDIEDRAVFTIPANAPNGTVIPYFCREHLTMMNPATIRIDSTVPPPP